MRRLLTLAAFAVAGAWSAPAGAQPRWRLVEDLRIGNGDEGPTSFNEIRDIQVDARGRIYAFDYQAQEIRLFAADGRFVRLVGRRGKGPGEYSQPNGIRLAPDGKLWVNDHRNARFVAFTAAGEYATQALVPPWGWSFRWNAVFDPQGRLIETFPIRASGGASSTPAIRRFDPAAQRLDTLAIPDCIASNDDFRRWSVQWKSGTNSGVFGVPFAPMMVTRLDPAGAWACATGDEYHARIVQLGTGAVVTDLRSSSAPLPIPDAVRDSVVAAIYEQTPQIPPGTLDIGRIPRNFPRIEDVDIDDKGRIWIRRRTATGLAFDVWSRNGIQMATIDSPVAFDRYRPFVVRDEKLYTVVADDDGVPAVVRYRIVR